MSLGESRSLLRVARTAVRRIQVVVWVSLGAAAFACFVAPQASAFGAHTFTTCGATGASGPSQSSCRASYSTAWDELDSDYYVVNGVQYWRVPQTGEYLVAAAGAQGGFAGGSAARSQGVLTFSAGTWVRILVGQSGSTSTGCRSIMDVSGCNVPQSSGGGGGGSFVASESGDPLVVAGGGGGASNQGSGDSSAVTSSMGASGPSFVYDSWYSPYTGTNDRIAAGGTGGAGGAGGNVAPVPGVPGCTDIYWIGGDNPRSDCHGGGGGGGGVTGSGSTAYTYNRGGRGGVSFADGGAGGAPDGGFGGGGGTGAYFIYLAYQRSGVSWQLGGAGGGGGFSGGGGGSGGYEGHGTFNGAAGGGSSFITSSAKQTATSTGSTGDGSVTITRITPDSPPVLDHGSEKVAKGVVLMGSGITYTGAAGTPTATTYSWQRCATLNDASSCTAITGSSGADGAWWGTRNADIGRQVRLSVTWTTALAVVTAFSDLSGVMIPEVSSPPALSSNSPVRNTRIHSSFGVWNGFVSGISTVSFDWQVCSSQTDAASCISSPSGTNGQWYRPTANDIGHYLRVTATMTTRGQEVSASSAITGIVRASATVSRARAAVVVKKRTPRRGHSHKQ